MTLAQIVHALCDLGIRASLEGDRITLTPPPPAELREALRAHKAELLGLLRFVEAEDSGCDRLSWSSTSGRGVEREVGRDEHGRVVALASWVRVH